MIEKHRVIPSVSIAVYDNIDKDIEVLLHRRANTGFRDGYYDLPSGHVEPDEMPILAAVRELKEETDLGVDVDDLELFHIRTNELDTPGSPYLYMFFRVEKVKCRGQYRINEPNKCDDMKFFKKNDLPEPTTQPSREAIEQLDSKVVLFSQTRTP
jgi:8-oxo-dGTP pyrophosphatase MutT (NUDIX family)